MIYFSLDLALAYVAWLIALVELIIGLYVLVLNFRHTANRHTGALLLVIATTSFAIGSVMEAGTPRAAYLPETVIAVTTLAIEPLLLLTTIALLKPEWLSGRVKWLWWSFYGLAVLPMILETFTQGGVSNGMRWTYDVIISIVTISILLLICVLPRKSTKLNRDLAWILLAATSIVGFVHLVGAQSMDPSLVILLTGIILAVAYSYACFAQMNSERRMERGSFLSRLTALILITAVPSIVMVTILLTSWAGQMIRYITTFTNLPESAVPAELSLYQRVAWMMAAIGIGLLLGLSRLTIRRAIRPIQTLKDTANAIAGGDQARIAFVETDDELGALTRAFNTMTSQLREQIASLERRLSDRNREVERRRVHLQLVAEVSGAASSTEDTASLLELIVHLISNRLNYSHAAIYLIDDIGKYAILLAASSSGGQQLLARGYKLEVGKAGFVGYVAGSGKSRLANDVNSDAVFQNDPELAHTLAELTLPMNARGKIVGVLDVQSTKPSAFSAEDITTLQMLADQVALAVENIRLAQETNYDMNEVRTPNPVRSAEGWRKWLGGQKISYSYHRQGSNSEEHSNSIQQNLDEESTTLKVPVLLGGHSIGSIILMKDRDLPGWTDEEKQVVTRIVAQLSLAMENARLVEEMQRRGEREQMMAEITARIRSSNDLGVIMQTAATELRNVLRVKQSQIVIHPGSEIAIATEGGNGHKKPKEHPGVIQQIDDKPYPPHAQEGT